MQKNKTLTIVSVEVNMVRLVCVIVSSFVLDTAFAKDSSISDHLLKRIEWLEEKGHLWTWLRERKLSNKYKAFVTDTYDVCVNASSLNMTEHIHKFSKRIKEASTTYSLSVSELNQGTVVSMLTSKIHQHDQRVETLKQLIAKKDKTEQSLKQHVEMLERTCTLEQTIRNG